MSKSKVIAQNRSLAIGLDVDSKTSYACVFDVATGQLLFDGRVKHAPQAWDSFLARFPDCQLWACYEAGGIGFWLCRRLCDRGVDCKVVAPSLVLKAPEAKQRKNDRQDAITLARLYWNPPRSWVRVPSEREEADRQLIRTRDQLSNDRTRLMNRIKALLRYYDLRPDESVKAAWSKSFRHWLSTCACRGPVRIALDALLGEMAGVEQQLAVLKKAINEMNKSETHRDKVNRLRQIPGVGPLTANAFVTELFRPADFHNGKQVAAKVGLTPSEWSSGQSVRHGHITHWGPSHLRKLLVEAAWGWVFRDPVAAARYARIRAGKVRKIAIVAMARKLAVIMWTMLVKEQDYQYA